MKLPTIAWSRKLPPKGDSARPMHMAISSLFLLGLVSILYGLMNVVVFGYFNRLARFGIYFELMGSGIWVMPGAVFIISAIFMKRRRRWAIPLALAGTVFQGLCAAVLLYFSLTLTPVSPIPIILCLVWLAALGQLIAHLWQSRLIVIGADQVVYRGFEPVMGGKK
jgi:hypothetical protein